MYWKKNATGRPLSYSPEELWEKAVEYFEFCDKNPWTKAEVIKGGEKAGEIVEVPINRPYTIIAFCLFAGITRKTFDNYGRLPEFLPFYTRIKDICYSQKFEGASVGAFNANIIARDLGLREVTDVNVTSEKKSILELFTTAPAGDKEPES